MRTIALTVPLRRVGCQVSKCAGYGKALRTTTVSLVVDADTLGPSQDQPPKMPRLIGLQDIGIL